MIINATIAELDIRHAAPSLWYELGVISKEKYEELISLPKDKRVVQCGLMQREDSIYTEKLHEGEDLYIEKLKKANKIPDGDILERVHDALWLIDYIPEKLKFGEVEFVVKGIYDLYYKYNRYEFYLEHVTNKLKTRGVPKVEKSPMLKLIRSVMIDYINQDKKLYDKLHKAKKNLEANPEYYGPPLGSNIMINLRIVKNMISVFI